MELVQEFEFLCHVSVIHPTCKHKHKHKQPESKQTQTSGSTVKLIHPLTLITEDPEPQTLVCGLTESSDELFEVDQSILVLVQQSEEASRQCRGVASTKPGSKGSEQLAELGRVNAVLLQVWQAGVMALCCRAAGTPITAGHVFGLKDSRTAL